MSEVKETDVNEGAGQSGQSTKRARTRVEIASTATMTPTTTTTPTTTQTTATAPTIPAFVDFTSDDDSQQSAIGSSLPLLAASVSSSKPSASSLYSGVGSGVSLGSSLQVERDTLSRNHATGTLLLDALRTEALARSPLTMTSPLGDGTLAECTLLSDDTMAADNMADDTMATDTMADGTMVGTMTGVTETASRSPAHAVGYYESPPSSSSSVTLTGPEPERAERLIVLFRNIQKLLKKCEDTTTKIVVDGTKEGSMSMPVSRVPRQTNEERVTRVRSQLEVARQWIEKSDAELGQLWETVSTDRMLLEEALRLLREVEGVLRNTK